MLGEPLVWPAKAPGEKVDYGIAWKKYLPAGDKVATSIFFVESEISGDNALILGTKAIVDNGLVTIIWLEGGTDGVTYHVLNRVVTEQGRTLEQERRITVSSDRY